MGLSLLALRAREAAEKGNPVARDYPSEYIKGLISLSSLSHSCPPI